VRRHIRGSGVAVASLAVLLSAVPAAAQPAAPAPGESNTITDVPGIRVGHVTKRGDGYLTGVTVVHAPEGARVGSDIRGGAPGTRETDLTDPRNAVQRANAVLLTGGSAYGWDSAAGVMQWLEEHNQGFRVGSQPGQVVPIVPGAVIYDLGRGGNFKARPTAEDGYAAIDAATDAPVQQGVVGGGTGAQTGGLKGGVGSASVVLADGTTVGAIVLVNAAGSTVDPDTCELLGARLELANEFGNLRRPAPGQCPGAQNERNEQSLNTTIAAIATDAPLDKAQLQKMAGIAHDGMARAISPVHTLSDGDSVFTLSTSHDEPLDIEADRGRINQVYNAAADTLTRAIVHAMLNAETVGNRRAYCDVYPTACAGTEAPGQQKRRGEVVAPVAQQPPSGDAPGLRLAAGRVPDAALLGTGLLLLAAAGGVLALRQRRHGPAGVRLR
jgi:L-aminopeptidase/D-esterase-like protein